VTDGEFFVSFVGAALGLVIIAYVSAHMITPVVCS
jgi:hypothetical protein